MFRTTSLTAVCLILASANSGIAQKPFKNKIARAAKKTYEEAVAKAKAEYAAQLEIAIKQSGGAGDIEEAKLLVAEKKRIDGSDPLMVLRRRLTGTKWNTNPTKRRQWQSFQRNNLGRNYDGAPLRWFVTAKNTVVTQRTKSTDIYVWHFDANLKKATLHAFTKAGKSPARRVR